MNLYGKFKKKVRLWLLRRLPACRETVAMISKSMDRPLTLRESLLVKVHLWICMWCQWYMEHLKTIRTTLRAQPIEPPESNFGAAPGLTDDAKERLKRRLSNVK
jgi:hypothetical protein